jgi:hypothetical protein
VQKAMTKFQSQLLAVLKAMPFERTRTGKISPVTAQTQGPQVEAKKKMKMQTKAMRTLEESDVEDGCEAKVSDAV